MEAMSYSGCEATSSNAFTITIDSSEPGRRKKITIFDSKEANQSRKLGLSCEDENQFKGT